MSDTFICRLCGDVCSVDEWNEDDVCDRCLDG